MNANVTWVITTRIVPAMSTNASPAQESRRSSRTHYLYIAVIIAVIAGIVVGRLYPDFGKSLQPLGTGFVNLVKMMISPIIFCTIVLGIGKVAKAATVGRIGALALGYFLIMSTVALLIGLVVGNWLEPGTGLKQGTPPKGDATSTNDFLLGIIPKSLLSSLTEGNVLQTLLVALLVGFALQALRGAGVPVLRGIEHIQKLVFKILAMIMWTAPIGAFGAM